MPAAENTVHIAPIHRLLLQHRLFIRHPQGLVVKAHIVPGGDISPLLGHQGVRRDVQQPEHLGLPAPEVGQALEMGLGPLHRVDALAGPDKALLFDLGQEGPPSRPVFSFHLLGTPAHQHQNNLGRQSQMVIECVQRPQVVGGQLFAQPPLHLVAQGGKGGCIFFQGGGNIL